MDPRGTLHKLTSYKSSQRSTFPGMHRETWKLCNTALQWANRPNKNSHGMGQDLAFTHKNTHVEKRGVRSDSLGLSLIQWFPALYTWKEKTHLSTRSVF